ncbi:uncharacterized protein TNCT_489462 [Trichonephila clavata]|uniref:Uncharacterized protein n=1 Tax=Trichonephila clavata TaxID=2740835 RepID=A0A8X6L7G4_TRICU|nr:uncharacterized protein TNCT_489462 [Trichonephila clavata]
MFDVAPGKNSHGEEEAIGEKQGPAELGDQFSNVPICPSRPYEHSIANGGDFSSPGKAPLGGGGDSLYQNVSGPPVDPKQNGPSAPETEGNVMYENMPFHRQGPVPSFPSARMRQSLPADFSRAYQNVLYCRQDYNPQQQQQWNNSDQRWMSGGSMKREPCPQHGVVPDSPEWAEVLPHPRKNGGSSQKCPNPSSVIYADLALPFHQAQPVSKQLTKYATLKFTSEAAKGKFLFNGWVILRQP